VAKLAYTNQSNHSTMLPAEPTQIFFQCSRPVSAMSRNVPADHGRDKGASRFVHCVHRRERSHGK
jgi:hypothetical protein